MENEDYVDNWDEIERDIDPDNDSDDEEDSDQPVNSVTPGQDERKQNTLHSSQAAILMAKQNRNQSSAANALAKQRTLLAKRQNEPRSLSPRCQRKHYEDETASQDFLISPRSPRSPRGAPTLRAGGRERPTPSLILPDERSVSPGPIRTNTPLPNIRASQSCSNLSMMPAPPSAPKSPARSRSPRSPRLQQKRNSIEELCDQLDDSMEITTNTGNSRSQEYHLTTPKFPTRSRSTETLCDRLPKQTGRPRSPARVELMPLAPLRDNKSQVNSLYNTKPVLRPI